MLISLVLQLRSRLGKKAALLVQRGEQLVQRSLAFSIVSSKKTLSTDYHSGYCV